MSPKGVRGLSCLRGSNDVARGARLGGVHDVENRSPKGASLRVPDIDRISISICACIDRFDRRLVPSSAEYAHAPRTHVTDTSDTFTHTREQVQGATLHTEVTDTDSVAVRGCRQPWPVHARSLLLVCLPLELRSRQSSGDKSRILAQRLRGGGVCWCVLRGGPPSSSVRENYLVVVPPSPPLSLQSSTPSAGRSGGGRGSTWATPCWRAAGRYLREGQLLGKSPGTLLGVVAAERLDEIVALPAAQLELETLTLRVLCINGSAGQENGRRGRDEEGGTGAGGEGGGGDRADGLAYCAHETVGTEGAGAAGAGAAGAGAKGRGRRRQASSWFGWRLLTEHVSKFCLRYRPKLLDDVESALRGERRTPRQRRLIHLPATKGLLSAPAARRLAPPSAVRPRLSRIAKGAPRCLQPPCSPRWAWVRTLSTR